MKIKIEIQSLGDDGYHIFCKLKVNGLKCRALIDTGASKTVLSKSLFKKLKLKEFKLTSDNRMTGIQPGTMNTKFVIVDTISIGKLEFINLVSGLIDMKHVDEQYKTLNIQPFQLILGGDILQKGKAVIDYKSKTLKLSK